MPETTIAYIGCGSNSGDSAVAARRAAEALEADNLLKVDRISPLFWTEPQGYRAQPWFANQVLKVIVQKNLNPDEFLEALLEVEKRLGRVRRPGAPRFGPRPIDLDLLWYGGMAWDTPACTVPHPRMHQRAFVLVPLLCLEPALQLRGHSLEYWLGTLHWRIEGRRIFQSDH